MNTDQLVGKHILTGLTWTDARGKLLRRTEYHGIIVSAGNGAVCFKRAEDDGEFTIRGPCSRPIPRRSTPCRRAVKPSPELTTFRYGQSTRLRRK